MSNDGFRFKQFMVRQDRTAMKVGTDGVLLGAWAGDGKPSAILDVGTGTGLIALMMAQRFPDAMIDAVEPDPDAASQAEENFSLSLWQERLKMYYGNFHGFAESCGKQYDLIVSNPPYFHHSLKAPAAGRTLARHDDSLPKETLLHDAVGLLGAEGQFAVILPRDHSGGFISAASGYSLFPHRVLRVRALPGKPIIREMVSFGFINREPRKEELVIESGGRHIYSEEYKKLTKDFYLAF